MITDFRADGDCLNAADLANDLKVHLLILVSCHRREAHHAAQRGASHKSESFATMTSGVDPKDERSAHVRWPHAFRGMRPSVTVDAIAPASAIRGFFHCA
jgi:hypothetical protein